MGPPIIIGGIETCLRAPVTMKAGQAMVEPPRSSNRAHAGRDLLRERSRHTVP
jgi:hypothetical protein